LSRKTEALFIKKSQRIGLARAGKYHNVSVLKIGSVEPIWTPVSNGKRLGIFTQDKNRHFYRVAGTVREHPVNRRTGSG
jgi:hypothetical protein